MPAALTPARRSGRPARRCHARDGWGVPAAALAMLLAASSALGQAVEPEGRDARRVFITGSEHMLWVLEGGREQGRIFYREPTSAFDLGRAINGWVVDLFCADGDAILVLADRSIWRYGPRVSLPERVLPDRARPIHLVGRDGVLYALTSGDVADKLAAYGPAPGAGQDPASQPFRSGLSELALVIHDREHGWRGLAPCPPQVQRREGELRPRLLAAAGGLFLACVDPTNTARVLTFLLDESRGELSPLDSVEFPRLAGFGLTTVSRVPSLVLVGRDESGAPTVAVYRRLGAPAAPGAHWQRGAELEPSSLPADVAAAAYLDAVGFNQGLALLMQDGDRQLWLQFAGLEAAPAEPAVAVRNVVTRPMREGRLHGLLQVATLLILVGLFVSFFVLRRTSLTQPLALPPGVEPALAFQRAAGGLIDFCLFALPWSLVLNVPWRDGLSQLANWGMFGGPSVDIPPAPVRWWWGLSSACFIVYCALFELLAQRTLGKAITGTRLASEDGAAPRLWQIVLRNAIRLIELMPQFWMLVVLVVVSRNRQRLGDIYARTLVVRQTAERPGGGGAQPKETPPSDSGDDSGAPPRP